MYAPFDPHVLNLAVLVLESAEDGLDDLVTDGFVENSLSRGAQELISKIAGSHEAEIGIYDGWLGSTKVREIARRLHLHRRE